MVKDGRAQVAHVRWICWAQTRLWRNSRCHTPSTRGSLLPPMRLRLSAFPPPSPSPPPPLPQPRLINTLVGAAVCQSCGGGEGVGSMSLSGGARQTSAAGRGAEGRNGSSGSVVWTRQHLREKQNANRRGAQRGSDRNIGRLGECTPDSSAWWRGFSPYL